MIVDTIQVDVLDIPSSSWLLVCISTVSEIPDFPENILLTRQKVAKADQMGYTLRFWELTDRLTNGHSRDYRVAFTTESSRRNFYFTFSEN